MIKNLLIVFIFLLSFHQTAFAICNKSQIPVSKETTVSLFKKVINSIFLLKKGDVLCSDMKVNQANQFNFSIPGKTDSSISTKQTDFFNMTKIETTKSFEYKDKNNNKKPYTGFVARVGVKKTGNYEEYQVVQVDKNGKILSQKGTSIHDNILRVSKKTFDRLSGHPPVDLPFMEAPLKNAVRNINPALASISTTVAPSYFCTNESPSGDQNLSNPTDLSFYKTFRSKRKELYDIPCGPIDKEYAVCLKNGVEDCAPTLRRLQKCQYKCGKKKEALEDTFLEKTPWAKMSLSERAQKVHSMNNDIFNHISTISDKTNISDSKEITTDSSKMHRLLDPKIASCIAYKETRGFIHPFKMNYTLCRTKFASSATGLSQSTRSALGLLRSVRPDSASSKRFNLIPLTYSKANIEGASSLSDREFHSKVSDNPYSQLEILIRHLNYELKFAQENNPKLNDQELIKKAVLSYDRDGASSYIKTVNACTKCMETKEASECYAISK